MTDLKGACSTWTSILSVTRLNEQKSEISEINPKEETSTV